MRPSVPHRLSVMANAGQSPGDDEESEEEEDGGRMGRQQQTRRTETREELVDAQAESTNQHGEARMMDARGCGPAHREACQAMRAASPRRTRRMWPDEGRTASETAESGSGLRLDGTRDVREGGLLGGYTTEESLVGLCFAIFSVDFFSLSLSVSGGVGRLAK